MSVTLPTQPTQKSDLTTFVITWLFVLKTWYNVRLNYALVDEVDSILIDEARTPLIVSGANAVETSQLYHMADHYVKSLDKTTISSMCSLRLLVCLIQGLTRLKATSSLKISMTSKT